MDAVSLVTWFPRGRRKSSSSSTATKTEGLPGTHDGVYPERNVSFSDSDSPTHSCSEGNQQQQPFSWTAKLQWAQILARYFPIALPALPFKEYHIGKKRRTCHGSQVKTYEEIPEWLRNNHFIRYGYLVHCSPRECVRSLLQWHNETVNIWSHLLGFFVLLAILFYDIFYRLPLIGASKQDTVACVLVTATYMCTFYAFHANPFWQRFYLTTEFIIVSAIYLTTFHPVMGLPVYEPRRNVLIAMYVAAALIPTGHWVLLDGLHSSIVQLLLPRVIIMFVYAGLAFVIFARRFPECLYPGTVDYFGASHQIWHLFVILAELSWHETGFMFLQCHLQSSCESGSVR
ncbi:progestin and adipoQ receptor family member 3-like [Tropilaelaps mercedesae]|uniref:Progestin and adipoQ receptor family member 3-like n=1 Tax=Tropilaelaps mercedesae TaxID=418985 RepID=A0A1V9X073_9ACAR|nr:progestin and adipoQ receptor family member 3-like [Tropilaelaps mercedesae]